MMLSARRLRAPSLLAFALATALMVVGGCGLADNNGSDGETGPTFVSATTPPGRTLFPVIVATTPVTQPGAQNEGDAAGDGDQNVAPAVSAAPIPSPGYVDLNGVPLGELLVMPPAVRERVREIFREGRRLGRDPRSFSKLGASVVDTQHFMGRFDYGPYTLGEYENLQPAIDHYRGSFERDSVSTRRGLSARTAFDPVWADKMQCQPNESVIDCEFRLHNPSVLLIALGTNDIDTAANFEQQMQAIIQHTIDNGVIPVLATKADRFEGPDNRNNNIIRRLASEYVIPLWDFDLLAETLPGRGISGDEVHLTLFDRYDYTSPTAYERGYGMYNLSALMMLEAIRQEMQIVEIEDSP
jgi:hypothetical protein